MFITASMRNFMNSGIRSEVPHQHPLSLGEENAQHLRSRRGERGLQYSPYPGDSYTGSEYDGDCQHMDISVWTFYIVCGLGLAIVICQLARYFKTDRRIRQEEEEARQAKIDQEQHRREDLLKQFQDKDRIMVSM
jgi:hypothetical protein